MWGLLLSFALAGELKVLMIDGGKPAGLVGKDITLYLNKDVEHIHADYVYQIITEGSPCPTVTVDSCTFLPYAEGYYECLRQANDYDIVNMSLAGTRNNPIERNLIRKLTRPLLVIAAGNRGRKELDPPARYAYEIKNIIPVSGLDYGRVPLASSNYSRISVWADGVSKVRTRHGSYTYIQGTSMAAANVTNKLIKELCPTRSKKIHVKIF